MSVSLSTTSNRAFLSFFVPSFMYRPKQCVYVASLLKYNQPIAYWQVTNHTTEAVTNLWIKHTSYIQVLKWLKESNSQIIMFESLLAYLLNYKHTNKFSLGVWNIACKIQPLRCCTVLLVPLHHHKSNVHPCSPTKNRPFSTSLSQKPHSLNAKRCTLLTD